MADDERQSGNRPEDENQDDDLGNLPPLSEFESSQGGGDEEEDSGALSGLPPISDIPVETPEPTGGARKPPPPGYEKSPGGLGTPTSDSGLDTPDEDQGFQDMAADSDFTPETPELGPESDLETPMFDSAFGSGDSDLSQSGQGQPTQAMETPMFGAAETPSPAGGGQDAGFDDDAFGGGAGGQGGDFDFGGGTPVPDFSPDTNAPTQPATPPPVTPAGPAAARGGGGGGGMLVAVIAAVVFLIIGLLLGPLVTRQANLRILNPWAAELEETQQQLQAQQNENSGLQRELQELRGMIQENPDVVVTAEEVERLRTQIQDLTAQRDQIQMEVAQVQERVDQVNRELELKNEQFVEAEEKYEALLNFTSIERARRNGLLAETQRLQQQVGELEQAEQRRLATKQALEHAVTLLAVQVREGLPLTPEKYNYAARVARVNDLEARVAAANWVDPELLRDYTELYLQELAIANTTEYFFAKVPVETRFGVKKDVWAECLMNGNWSVYFRTIDGKHIGIFQDVGMEGPPLWEFQADLGGNVQSMVEEAIIEARPSDFEQKIQVLAQKQTIVDGKSDVQRVYDSM